MKLPKELTTVTPLSRIVAVIFLIAAILIGFGLGINHQETIELLKKQNNPVPVTVNKETILTTDETVNWKTYTNTKLSYSLKYPQNIFRRVICPTNIQLPKGHLLEGSFVLDKKSDYNKEDEVRSAFCNYQPNEPVFKVDVYEGIQVDLPETNAVYTVSSEDISVNGIKSRKYTAVKNPTEQISYTKWFTKIYIPYKNYTYVLYTNDKTLENIFDQILATFRFTN